MKFCRSLVLAKGTFLNNSLPFPEPIAKKLSAGGNWFYRDYPRTEVAKHLCVVTNMRANVEYKISSSYELRIKFCFGPGFCKRMAVEHGSVEKPH
jgi:hypothetical protein